ncbi:MAG: hypothetical protein UZ07_CHB004001451 [Chlorobi bacterium OLB7]|nr:MAG: hypothetical protein UZ07_CHB004001451 [Chlorobi bacterium OLB7]
MGAFGAIPNAPIILLLAGQMLPLAQATSASPSPLSAIPLTVPADRFRQLYLSSYKLR